MIDHRFGIIDSRYTDFAVTSSVITEQGHVVAACAYSDKQAVTVLDKIASGGLVVDALLIESDLSRTREFGASARDIINRIDELGINPFLIANCTIGMPEDLADRFGAIAIKAKIDYFKVLRDSLAMITGTRA